jgi:hypothetical protein
VEEGLKLQGEGLVSVVQVTGVPRHFGHDVEVLRRQRCEQLGLLPHSGGLQERCGVTTDDTCG